MRVEILSTGSELLRGRNVDTNAAWMARELEKAGLEVLHHQTVDDHFGRLVDALKLALARSDVVLLTGGLGPTEDDYTRAVAAEAFHRPLVFRDDLWAKIRDRFRRYRIRMAAINRRQAFAPEGASVLPNPFGSAPGFAIRQDGVFFAAMPGPPRELYPMFLRHVLPRIRRRADFELWEGKSFGVPEGTVDEIVRRVVGAKATYGLTVRGGQVTISIRAEGARRKKTLADLSRRVRAALGEAFYEGELHETVARRLMETGTTIAVAESCTGGLITHRLTEVPGVSAVLLEAVVAYSNASKGRRLGVPEELIRRHGAVSEEVARAMAEGVARTSGAALGVAVTGIAGPGGGTAEKPVGLCYLAVNGWVERRVFSGERSHVKERAAGSALNMVRLALLRGEGHAREKVGFRPGGPRRKLAAGPRA
jgi:nicotinamide-nucleotide amidase